ncbi:hypothetical protein [Pseudomonas aeruginosa]|uniref:hypothetical protein n=1 Tax=Pseudomonas aeruginosa TaxID=287 RepID=UPI00044BAD09|nr:hypothetical protein [Pseudomonas aeruginosa]KAJ17395.1 hypothetical protein M003_29890 [Pseudomonas aeruginosa IGB83]
MNDRTLLELAARAAGMNVQRSRLDDPLHRDFLMNGEGARNPGQCSFPWNPLTDDGDALRLAVLLNLEIHSPKSNPTVMFRTAENDVFYQDACIRLAITRAAAEIGTSMGGGE